MFSDVRLGVSVSLSSRTGWLRTDVISIDNLGRVNVLGSNRFVGGAENHLEIIYDFILISTVLDVSNLNISGKREAPSLMSYC